MAALDLGSSSSSAASTSTGSSSYDVFLNFRGEDTRKNFTGFLYKTLKDRGINVFLDSEKLWTGEAIGPALHKAIEGSKISIPVFSKGYADSKWCLQELAHIVQCQTSNNQIVIPIFFHVDPSDVRNQTGTFEEAFRKHEKNFESSTIESWRKALRVVGNLNGEVLDETKDQAKIVELVVKRALGELVSSTHLAECKYRIDMDSKEKDLLSLLNIGSNDVQFVGICGFGGIGKTTIAKAVYNRTLSTFNKHSFLSDVREHATQCMGLLSLQKRFLHDIINTDIDISDLHRGKKLIEERVCKKKVLLVLDDVDSKEQIDALAGELNWFGQGSRIIITTRDEHILNLAKVNRDKIYRPQLLDLDHSLQLFSWHAFQNNQPPEDYMELSRDVAVHSRGLPLTLEVFGSYLSDLSDREEWESTLQSLKEIPPNEVQRRLKISYDNLENHYQKAIFLDAACFFIEWKKAIIISIWEALGYNPKAAINRLIKRSLLHFEYRWDGEYLMMHDHIRDMGREIVLEESRMDPGKRSRLWSHGEILEVLEGQMGTDMIKSMSLPRFSGPPINLTSESFEMMPNLRFLNISSAEFMGDFSRFPSALRWLATSCSQIFSPTNFYHKRLVYLNLSWNKFKQVWNIRPQDENKRFQNLKVLNLSWCENLSKSPDFSWFPYLEQLNLTGCDSLDELDESIGKLSQLKSLILNSCYSLKKLPDGVGLLQKLKVLNFGYCSKLVKLPRSMGGMRCLDSINLYRINITKFPDVFLMPPNLPESSEAGNILSKSASIPPNLSKLKFLKTLKLWYCKKLEEIPGLEGTESLEELDARGCYNLTNNTPRMKVQIAKVKFCEILFKNREPDQQQKPNQHSSAFNYVDEDGGVVTLNYWPAAAAAAVDDDDDDYDYEASGPSFSLSLTCWPPAAEVEGSNSFPFKEKAEEEGMLLMRARCDYNGASLDNNEDEEEEVSFPSLSLALTSPCVVLELNDGFNQQMLQHPSFVQENTEEEDRNNTAVDFLSCLGLDSVSDAMEEEGEMMVRPSKRARLLLNNDDDEALDGPSLSL
ncbi:TMV resistance protein N-like [Telopea speciosissima]|uniref:TMV resistance protein N-like n=1 Tax=Telopea speciosissima TaxID=54955 RepID=UPI001CC3BFED|nr:TMV resistance protein N-like [Telopea speciosissima]